MGKGVNGKGYFLYLNKKEFKQILYLLEIIFLKVLSRCSTPQITLGNFN